MQNTLALFQDRKDEIDLYFRAMEIIDSGNKLSEEVSSTKLFKIMKSNLLLMLYNLIEACIRSGFIEIYESVNNDELNYGDLINKLQKLWVTSKLHDLYDGRAAASMDKFISTAESIIEESREQASIRFFSKNTGSNMKKMLKMLNMNGNLSSKRITEICDRHEIRYRIQNEDSKGCIDHVKSERNKLSHGEISFINCAQDLTLQDIEKIKNGVFQYIEDILTGMNDYFDNKNYKKQAAA